MDICPRCGLPKEACACDQIVKSVQRIKVTIAKRRYGKITTIVSGFEKSVNIKDIAKQLKNELACGGTFKNDTIELQGDHKKQVKPILIRLGFREDQIED